jgi:dTDP-4-dehydrorhamnose reductase
MKVLVPGAAGLLGAVTVRRWSDAGHEVIGWTRTDVDVTHGPAVRAAIAALQPDLILNCTAYNKVDDAEGEPAAALAVNAWAVRALARAADECGATLVHYSTDFVFEGAVDRPLTEEDAAQPRNVYGASKLLGEWLALEVPRHYVLRVESLFGGAAARSTIDRMLEAMRAGREVTAFVDRTVTPSYVPDIAWATEQLVSRRASYGVYHVVNTGSATWVEVAEALRREAALPDAAIRAVPVAAVPMRAPRPQFAALSNDKLTSVGIVMPTWQNALARHLSQ